MARLMNATDEAVYRAVITTVHHALPAERNVETDFEAEHEWTYVEYAGPYRRSGPAVSAINSEKTAADRWNYRQQHARFPGQRRTVEGHVERAELKWKAVK